MGGVIETFKPVVLVVGAQPESLGSCIAWYGRKCGLEIVTAGISGAEDLPLDVRFQHSISMVLKEVHATSIICTAGINSQNEMSSMEINYHGVMRLLDYWIWGLSQVGQFVAISSNSAHVARTNSRAYCASKAALSMGIRCAAREDAGRRALIYAWEFGLLAGTPMTQAVQERLGPGTALTRMPGHPNGQSVEGAARLVVDTLRVGTTALNGCTLRVDGGDQ